MLWPMFFIHSFVILIVYGYAKSNSNSLQLGLFSADLPPCASMMFLDLNNSRLVPFWSDFVAILRIVWVRFPRQCPIMCPLFLKQLPIFCDSCYRYYYCCTVAVNIINFVIIIVIFMIAVNLYRYSSWLELILLVQIIFL